MQQLSYYISGLLASLVYLTFVSPRVVVRTEVQTIEKRDPTGLIHNDIKFIKRHMPEMRWKEGDTLETIAHKQGFWDLLAFIETKVIGRRFDER